MPEDPSFIFYRLASNARKPVQADKSASGLLPTRAYRFCEAARAASCVGWYLFPPVDFSVKFDGATVYIRADDGTWSVLDAVQRPETAEEFDANCPEKLRGHCPPFVAAAENGVLQVWTGLILKSSPGWGALVRKPPNVPPKYNIDYFEGFIRTDLWFGPLFYNFRLLHTNVEYRFATDWPICFVQPIKAEMMDPQHLQNVSYVSEISQFEPEDWRALETTLHGRSGPDRVKGQYAVNVRREP